MNPGARELCFDANYLVLHSESSQMHSPSIFGAVSRQNNVIQHFLTTSSSHHHDVQGREGLTPSHGVCWVLFVCVQCRCCDYTHW